VIGVERKVAVAVPLEEEKPAFRLVQLESWGLPVWEQIAQSRRSRERFSAQLLRSLA
jgi:hypothetical protein